MVGAFFIHLTIDKIDDNRPFEEVLPHILGLIFIGGGCAYGTVKYIKYFCM
jgi:hypothetical protein